MLNVNSSQMIALARWHFDNGRNREAGAAARSILEADPTHATARMVLGAIALEESRFQDAVDCFGEVVKNQPQSSAALNNLGLALRNVGRIPEALECLERATELAPQDATAHVNLADTLRAAGDPESAVAMFRAAVGLHHEVPDVWFRMGNALVELGRHEEAAECYRQAALQRPTFLEAWINLGTAYKNIGKLDESVIAYRQAMRIDADSPVASNNLGALLMDKAMLDEALLHYHEAADSPRASAAAGSGLVYAMRFHPRYDDRAIGERARQWGKRYAAPLAPNGSDRAATRTEHRRLRIGYLSPDFRDHCQALFMTPLLRAHDRQAFEIYCYASVPRPDAVTRMQQSLADRWQDVARLSDDQVAERIRADEIDILVDLTMHMSGSRVLVLARKPAPVQATWLAYPGTTGMSAIDYRLTDPHLDPPGCSECVYAERTIRLPHTFWCYDPGDSRSLPVNELPALKQGHITFGCLNNFCKVNDGVLALWAQVLGRVPGSRLLLLASPGDHRDRVLRTLSTLGVKPERVSFTDFAPRQKYMENFHRIDISLDTLPYNGHTTSLDNYYMGVPVITRVGNTIVGRAGLSQLINLEHPELIAHTDSDFVRIATALAGDLPRLKELRATLRSRMEHSPLMDANVFARDIENAYRQMWAERTVSASPESLVV